MTAVAPLTATSRPNETSVVLDVSAWPSWSAAARRGQTGLIHMRVATVVQKTVDVSQAAYISGSQRAGVDRPATGLLRRSARRRLTLGLGRVPHPDHRDGHSR